MWYLKVCQHIISNIIHDLGDLFRCLYLTISDGFVESFHLTLIALSFFCEFGVLILSANPDRDDPIAEFANNVTTRKIVHAGFVASCLNLVTLRFNKDEDGYGKFSPWGFCIYPITCLVVWRFHCVYTAVNFLLYGCSVLFVLVFYLAMCFALTYRILELLYRIVKGIINYFEDKYYEAVEEMDNPESTTPTSPKVQPFLIETPNI